MHRATFSRKCDIILDFDDGHAFIRADLYTSKNYFRSMNVVRARVGMASFATRYKLMYSPMTDCMSTWHSRSPLIYARYMPSARSITSNYKFTRTIVAYLLVRNATTPVFSVRSLKMLINGVTMDSQKSRSRSVYAGEHLQHLR